jgi:sarcosine oxidase
LTPERDLVLDRLPDAPGVVVGLGAAHGFKFASVVGRILVELALEGATPSSGEIGAFRVDRPALLAADPPIVRLV